MFDTRMHAPLGLNGSAAGRIAARLRKVGLTPCAEPEAFFVDRRNQLDEGELARARARGTALATSVATAAG